MSSISGPSPSSLFASFPICPKGWEKRPLWLYWEAVSSRPIGPGRNPRGLPHQPFPSFLEAQGISCYPPLPQDWTSGSKLLGEPEPWCQTSESATAVPLNLHVGCGRWGGGPREIEAAQAPVGLCLWGCPPPPPPALAHPPGQDAPGDSPSHQSRKTSSAGHFNLPPTGRHRASGCPQQPLTRGGLPLLYPWAS